MQDIKTYTKASLGFVLDCVGTAQSATLCYATFGRAGGTYVGLEKYSETVAASRKAVRADWAMGPTMFGRKIVLGEGYSSEPDEGARAFAERWYPLMESLVRREGGGGGGGGGSAIRCHPIRKVTADRDSGGSWAEAVIRGMGWVREGSVSGQKLVVDLDI